MIQVLHRFITAVLLCSAAISATAYAAEQQADPYHVDWKEPQTRRIEVQRPPTMETWGVVKQGDVQTKFLRSIPYLYSSYELHEIHKDGKVEYLFHVQGEYGSDGTVPRLTIGTKEDTAFELTPVAAADLKTTPSKDYTDYWYYAGDLSRWTALEESAKKGKVNAYFYYSPNGKGSRAEISPLVKRIPHWLTLPIEECNAYGPKYSVFYPGMSAKELRDAIAYRSNAHYDSGRAKTSNKYVFSDVGNLPSFALHPPLSIAEVHYVTFREEPAGTWVNWDYWEPMSSGIHPLDTIGYITQAVYVDLYPTKYYGFTLKGHAEKRKWIIDTVDTKRHPELAAVSPDDVIKSLNGIPVDGYPKYVAEYLMYYSALGDLELVLENPKTGLYEVTVRSMIHLPLPAIDYAAYNEKSKLRYTKKPINEFRLDGAVPFEIFDPLGNPAAHVESPRTDWILEHFHTERPHTMPLGKYFAAAAPQY